MTTADQEVLFAKIDVIVANIENQSEPALFPAEKSARESRTVSPLLNDNAVFANLVEIVAYSQLTNSGRVNQLLASGALRQVFLDFDVDKVRQLNPCDVVDDSWALIKAIQKKTKVFQLVQVARAFHRMGQFTPTLNATGIPTRIESAADVDAFWKAFSKFQKVVASYDIPFLRSLTSLLHMLLHMGFDCVKPDVIVMDVAHRLKIVEGTKGDGNLKKVVRTLQLYALSRGIRPGVVDLYFLIQGGQSDARKFVKPGFKPAQLT